MTGAARTAFLVKTPAVAQLVALTRSATSGVPSAFRPAGAAAALNARGEVTEPLAISASPEDIGGKIPRGRRLCNRSGRRIIAQLSREARSMSEPFLSSDDYDERAHQLYNEGQYDEAIETLRRGLGLYPHAVELHVGMGYARLAREEYVWARRAFEESVGLDPEHEDALAGRPLRRARHLAANRAQEERVSPPRRRSRAGALASPSGRARGRGGARRPPPRGDRGHGAGRPDPRPAPARAVRHAPHRAAGDESTLRAGRHPSRQHAERPDLRGHVGRNRAADEGRRRGVGTRLARAVHGRDRAPGPQRDRGRDPGDGPGKLHPRECRRRVAENPALTRGPGTHRAGRARPGARCAPRASAPPLQSDGNRERSVPKRH